MQQNKPKKKCADQFWIRDLNLHISDKQVLLNPVGRLTDDIVNAAQAQQFPDIQGLQRPSLGQVMNFCTQTGGFLQILHTNNHW